VWDAMLALDAGKYSEAVGTATPAAVRRFAMEHGRNEIDPYLCRQAVA